MLYWSWKIQKVRDKLNICFIGSFDRSVCLVTSVILAGNPCSAKKRSKISGSDVDCVVVTLIMCQWYTAFMTYLVNVFVYFDDAELFIGDANISNLIYFVRNVTVYLLLISFTMVPLIKMIILPPWYHGTIYSLVYIQLCIFDIFTLNNIGDSIIDINFRCLRQSNFPIQLFKVAGPKKVTALLFLKILLSNFTLY